MTSEASEKIWLRWEPGKAITQGPLTEHPDYTEYTRTDTALAMVAAEREACAKLVWPNPLDSPPRKPTADEGPEYRQALNIIRLAWVEEIRARTNDDAKAALEQVKREARNEGLREAADKCRAMATQSVTQKAKEHASCIEEAILALMKGQDDD